MTELSTYFSIIYLGASSFVIITISYGKNKSTPSIGCAYESNWHHCHSQNSPITCSCNLMVLPWLIRPRYDWKPASPVELLIFLNIRCLVLLLSTRLSEKCTHPRKSTPAASVLKNNLFGCRDNLRFFCKNSCI